MFRNFWLKLSYRHGFACTIPRSPLKTAAWSLKPLLLPIVLPNKIPKENVLQLAHLHEVLDELGTETPASGTKKGTSAAKQAAETGSGNEEDHAQQRSEQMQNALATTTQLWKRDRTEWPLESVDPANRGFTRLRGRHVHCWGCVFCNGPWLPDV